MHEWNGIRFFSVTGRLDDLAASTPNRLYFRWDSCSGPIPGPGPGLLRMPEHSAAWVPQWETGSRLWRPIGPN